MSEFTSGEWKYLEWPMSFTDGNEQWYLVGSPERAVGFIRHEEDAKLVAAAPELYELVKEELIPTSDYGGILSFSREAKIKKLLARIEGEEAKHEK